MASELSDEPWKPIDEWILQGWIIKAIREAAGAGSREAGDIFHDRYDMLRASPSEDFVCDRHEFGRGFYSWDGRLIVASNGSREGPISQ